MTHYAILANGCYWGAWDASDEASAMLAAAADIGTEGSTDGFEAIEVTADQEKALDDWASNGSPASAYPLAVSHK